MIGPASALIAALISGFLLYCALFQRQATRIAWRNLFRHKRRSFSTAAAIMVGGVAMFIYGGFSDHAFWMLQQQTIRMNVGHLQLYHPDYFHTADKNRSLIAHYPTLKAAMLANRALADDIAALSGQLEFSGVISQYEHKTSRVFAGVGIEPVPALKLGAFEKRLSGSDLSRIKTEQATLGSGLAAALQARYGDWLDVLAVNSRGGQGALSLQLRGTFASGIKDYDDAALKVPLVTAQRIMETDGVSKVLILLKNDSDLPAFRAKLQRYLQANQLPLIIKSWRDISLYYQQVENLLAGIAFFIRLIVALIAIFMIGNALMMNITERTREIATLRALGLQPALVMRLFLLEGIFIGGLGGAGSLLLGGALGALINLQGVAMPPSPGQTQGYTAFIKMDSPELFAITFFLPVLTAALAAIVPARRAARLTIADAFKSG